MFLRQDDGNRYASRHIFNIFSKFLFLKHFDGLKLNLLCNRNIDPDTNRKIINKIFNDKYFPRINFNILAMRNNFLFKNNKFSFNMNQISSKIDLSDIIVVNFHYYNQLINDLSILKLKKIIVIVHDVFSRIDGNKKQFIDKENIYYVFISSAEYKSVNLNFAKKYLIYPFKNVRRLVEKKKKY